MGSGPVWSRPKTPCRNLIRVPQGREARRRQLNSKEGQPLSAVRLWRSPRRLAARRDLGFFDRMFPDLNPLVASDADLAALAAVMKETAPGDTSLDNPNVPAGFTYLGQFIDHDISLDLSPLSAKAEDPTMIENFRTPGLDLDCLYGAGLGPHRFLFRQDAPKTEVPDRHCLSVGGCRAAARFPRCPTISSAAGTASPSSAIIATTRTCSSRRPTWRS